jgi:carbamoyl-phosphate synthase large subunit
VPVESDPWFLRQIEAIIYEENMIAHNGLPNTETEMRRLKAMGFSDKRLATLAVRSVGVAGGLGETQAKRSGLLHDALRAMAGATSEEEVRKLRRKLGVYPVFKRIDSCAAEFEAITPYMYSTYEAPSFGEAEDEADPSDRKKIVILGGGPNRIGQGIEFDYCCVHACFALAEAGFETIMVNCNPETVSTDYDTSDRLYFEPLTEEDVLEIMRVEMSKGEVVGVIVQFGGQTPLKLAAALGDKATRILIYCNNNFSDNTAPVMLKRVELALNVPTFINLYGYGYENIYELKGAHSIRDGDIHWVSDWPELAPAPTVQQN